MSQTQHSEPGDDFAAEVSDIHPRRANTTPTRPALVAPDTHTAWRQRIVRLALTAALVLLAAVVLLGGIPTVRQRVLGFIPGFGPTPTPTPTEIPGDNLFSLLPNPPGVSVTLDGSPLANPPQPGDPRPLRLSRGSHIFAWRSAVLPFKPFQCRVSVPDDASDTCPFVKSDALPRALSPLHGAVIGLHGALNRLSPADAAQLTAAIQAALDAKRSTATVQPGESYLVSSPGQNATTAIARQSLQAALTYTYLPNAGYPEPCILAEPAIPCRFPGQNCSQLCTVPSPPPSIATSGAWIAAVTVRASWDYTTQDGRTIARGAGEAYGVQLAALRITWDQQTGWHVAVIAGHTPGFDLADDLTCDPARFALSQTASWSFMLDDPPPDATVQFASSATLADGCAARLTHGQPALFLQRFGVLLTVNDTAVNPADHLPAASPAEQDLALHLLAQLTPSSS